MVKNFRNSCYRAWIRFQYDRKAQDLIEYAMIAASAAVIVSALFPSAITSNLSNVIRTVRGYLRIAAGTRKTFESGGPDLFD